MHLPTQPTNSRVLWTVLLLFGAILPIAARAESFLQKFFHHDVEVIAVTDMTDAGRAFPVPTRDAPVYYMIIDLGEKNFGPSWAGDKIPDSRDVRKWMKAALAEQGYLLADKEHPPTQLFVLAWGMLRGGTDRPALGFLGGEKADLMWEQEQQLGGMLNPRVLLRDFQRGGIAGEIWATAEHDLYLGLVRSYTMDSLKGDKTTMLWETRFACPATGHNFASAMPQLVKAAALHVGRDTPMPVSINATEQFGGHVELGELKVIGTEPASGTAKGNPPAEAKPDKEPKAPARTP
jgi:hypothetical protein